MNWTWNLRSRDGGMEGLEFARCITAGGCARAFVHAAPSQAWLEVVASDGKVVARGDADRDGPYSPMTLLDLDGGKVLRSEVWPADEHLGLPVILAGGEVGILTAWHHAEDRSWWRWSVEFANHTGRPPDWKPPSPD
jgi:GAF domain-containing protein